MFDLLTVYYYTSIPLLTCNMLFYSITALSNSIVSSQHIIKFVKEHKECDSIAFKNELDNLDIQNKLKIIESLIFDIIKRYCKTNEEFEQIRHDVNNPDISSSSMEISDVTEIEIVELKNRVNILERIDDPIRYALLSTSEIVQTVNTIITNIYRKILEHEKSYIKKIISLCLQQELAELNKQTKILDMRLQLLLDLLKIYLPCQK